MTETQFVIIAILACVFIICLLQIAENLIRRRVYTKRLRRESLHKEIRRHRQHGSGPVGHARTKEKGLDE